MRGFATNKALSGGHRPTMWRRQFVAIFAILGLYLQLAAGVLCATDISAAAAASGFPICHSGAGDATIPSKPGNAPQQEQHSCPFCALHCHAALVPPPALPITTPFVVAIAQPVSHSVELSPLRLTIAAQARGPPFSA